MTLCFVVALWRIVVVCAIVMQNLWITCYFFVRQLILCGCICFGCLGSIGSCQVQLWTYYFVSIIGLGSIVLIFGIWFQAVLCGLFRLNGIGGLLRMRGKLWFSYQSYANKPSLIGLGIGVSRFVLPLWIFFRLLEQLRGCLCLFVPYFPLFTAVNSLYFSCYFFINNILFLLIKFKKEKKKRVYNPLKVQGGRILCTW